MIRGEFARLTNESTSLSPLQQIDNANLTFDDIGMSLNLLNHCFSRLSQEVAGLLELRFCPGRDHDRKFWPMIVNLLILTLILDGRQLPITLTIFRTSTLSKHSLPCYTIAPYRPGKALLPSHPLNLIFGSILGPNGNTFAVAWSLMPRCSGLADSPHTFSRVADYQFYVC